MGAHRGRGRRFDGRIVKRTLNLADTEASVACFVIRWWWKQVQSPVKVIGAGDKKDTVYSVIVRLVHHVLEPLDRFRYPNRRLYGA